MESVTESFPKWGMLSFIKKGNGSLPDDFCGRILNSLVSVFYRQPPHKSGHTGPCGFSALDCLVPGKIRGREGNRKGGWERLEGQDNWD